MKSYTPTTRYHPGYLLLFTAALAVAGCETSRDTGAASTQRARAAAVPAQVDSAAIAAVVERFHHALAEGDSAEALVLLAEDAVILESGGIESRQEYRSHHLPADIAFVRAVKGTRSPVGVNVRGDVAWATATSTTRGTYRGRPVNSAGAELLVLTRAGAGWRINAIHWSSRSLP